MFQTVRQVARYLEIPESLVRRLVAQGVCPGVYSGNRFDGLFEEPVCDSIFGSMNLYAMADGLHVWTNFLLALMDETDSAFAREQKATNPRIQKYTAKYRR